MIQETTANALAVDECLRRRRHIVLGFDRVRFLASAQPTILEVIALALEQVSILKRYGQLFLVITIRETVAGSVCVTSGIREGRGLTSLKSYCESCSEQDVHAYGGLRMLRRFVQIWQRQRA